MTWITTRGAITEALTETANVLTGSVTDNLGGGGTTTYGTSADVRCRIDALGGDEGEIAERLSDRSTHLVTLPPGTEVSVADDLSIDGRGTYEVTAVRENTDEHARFVEVVPH
jgi:hypothetical protein